MNPTKAGSWILLAVLVLTLSGWYFRHGKTVVRLDKETLSTTVDTTITDLTVRQFDAKGKLIHVLKTPLLEHVPKGDLNYLDKPYILIAQDNQPAWQISSLKALAEKGGKRITFTKQVLVHQPADEKTLESTLKTEKVTYYPNEKKATTDALVTFEQPGNFVQSTGMNAYLDEKRVELLHRARGSYVPAKG